MKKKKPIAKLTPNEERISLEFSPGKKAAKKRIPIGLKYFFLIPLLNPHENDL